ncbi:MAG: hypothetical protein AAFY16_07475 [Cyanobacteria bacterium J06642_3]
MNKYFLNLPTPNGTEIIDCGENERRANIFSQVYDAVEGWICLIEEPNTGLYRLRLPNPKYLQSPANCSQPWLYQESYENLALALNAAQKYGCNAEAKINIITSAVLQEFRQVHFVLRLKRFNEFPQLDLTNAEGDYVIDEFQDAFEALILEQKQNYPQSAFSLVEEIYLDFESTNADIYPH